MGEILRLLIISKYYEVFCELVHRARDNGHFPDDGAAAVAVPISAEAGPSFQIYFKPLGFPQKGGAGWDPGALHLPVDPRSGNSEAGGDAAASCG